MKILIKKAITNNAKITLFFIVRSPLIFSVSDKTLLYSVDKINDALHKYSALLYLLKKLNVESVDEIAWDLREKIIENIPEYLKI